MSYYNDFYARLSAQVNGDTTFLFAVGYRDEVARARALAESVKGRWTGLTVESDAPKQAIDASLAKVNAAWDSFYGWFLSQAQANPPDDVDWNSSAVTWVVGQDTYDGRAGTLIQALTELYNMLDGTVDIYGASSTIGDLVKAGGAAEEHARKALHFGLDELKPILYVAMGLVAIIVGVAVFVKAKA